MPYTYPPARKGDTIDNFHGTNVPDPYRWMEDVASDESQAWLKAQAALTTPFMDALPEREKIQARMTELWNFPKYSTPQRYGSRTFFFKNDGLQNQDVLYRQDTPDAKPQMIIDPNTFSSDGTVALVNIAYSEDGKYIAYARSTSGSDLQEIFVHDVDAGKDLGEVLKWVRFVNMTWKHDNSGFYYNRYPEPGSVPPEEVYYHNKVYFHKIGTPQSADVLVYERPDAIEYGFGPVMSEDGQNLWLVVWHSSSNRNRLYYRPAESNGDFIRLIDTADAMHALVGSIGSTLYMHTDQDAPRGRVVAIDMNHPDGWKDVVPQTEDVISFAGLVNNQIVVALMHDAYHRLVVYNLDGSFDCEIPLPTIGSVFYFSGRQDRSEVFINFQSFLYPPTILSYDLATHQLTTLHDSGLDLKAELYETREVFATSKDGTRVPIFVTHKKGLKLDGQNPTLLHSYGGYSVNKLPEFSVADFYWVEQGGVYAMAVLRGGGEYGEEWHQGGMLANKENCFNDYIAAAEWLIQNKYTSPKKLAIYGRSNGGLLVAACMLQRPDLYGAVLCVVPVTDMLRYSKFTAGRFWVDEYGDAENPDHFPFLIAYSPAHNVKSDVTYPPIIVMTAESDDRVVPMHSMKFTAALQASGTSENPILLRFEFKAGHGFGKPTSKQIDEYADMFAFAYHAFENGS